MEGKVGLDPLDPSCATDDTDARLAQLLTVAAPIPDDAPVTTAVFPRRSILDPLLAEELDTVDRHRGDRPVAAVALDGGDRVDDVEARDNPTEHRVLAVEPGACVQP